MGESADRARRKPSRDTAKSQTCWLRGFAASFRFQIQQGEELGALRPDPLRKVLDQHQIAVYLIQLRVQNPLFVWRYCESALACMKCLCSNCC